MKSFIYGGSDAPKHCSVVVAAADGRFVLMRRGQVSADGGESGDAFPVSCGLHVKVSPYLRVPSAISWVFSLAVVGC